MLLGFMLLAGTLVILLACGVALQGWVSRWAAEGPRKRAALRVMPLLPLLAFFYAGLMQRVQEQYLEARGVQKAVYGTTLALGRGFTLRFLGPAEAVVTGPQPGEVRLIARQMAQVDQVILFQGAQRVNLPTSLFGSLDTSRGARKVYTSPSQVISPPLNRVVWMNPEHYLKRFGPQPGPWFPVVLWGPWVLSVLLLGVGGVWLRGLRHR